MTKLKFSNEEELNIVALHEAEMAAKKSSQFDNNYQKLQEELENKPEEGSNDPSSVSDDSDIPSDETPAQETFKNSKLVTEDYISLESEFLTSVKDSIFDGVKYLGYVGITYGPSLFKNVYKGALKVVIGIIRLLVIGIESITKYLNRRFNDFDRLKEQIKSLKEKIKDIEDPKDIDNGLVYTNTKIINQLKIGSSIDLAKNISSFSSFLEAYIKFVDQKVKDELDALKYIISIDVSNTRNFDESFMSIKASDHIFSEGTIKGYEVDSDLLVGYFSKATLPGDVKIITQLPTRKYTSKEEIINAYNKSIIHLGIDTVGFKSIDNIHYMNSDTLISYLDELEKLCDLCIKHRLLYESVIRGKANLRFNFKNYFNGLFHRDEKLGIRNSFIEYVYLKAMFVDKIYMAAAMDIHDYSISTIKNSLSFVNDNISKL